MSGQGTPPGWYPDPWSPAGVRWWDGQDWTAHAAAPSWAAPKGPADLVGEELESARWVRWGLRAQAAYVVLAGPVVAAALRQVFDLFVEIGDVAPGETVSFTGPTPGAFVLLQLVGVAQWVGLIAFLVWQHRANVAAQALGLWLTRSPGWGVGGWFIPIANLWFPYEAVRDALPPDDPVRPLVMRWWLGLLVSGVLIWIGAAGYAFGGLLVGLPLSLATAAFAWWWCTTSITVVDGIGATHARLAGVGA